MLKLDIPDLGIFVKSLVINFDIAADFMNRQLKYYRDMEIPEDKSEWIYYLNMAGLPHAINTDIKIVSLDDDTEFIMTKENIEDHPLTRSKLLEFDIYFKFISDNNSNQDSYIRGMLRPIDLETAINAKNNEVLFYDQTEIGSNERHVIYHIEKALTDFQDRWVMTHYMFEDRYVPVVIAQCYSLIVPTILNSRISVLNTEKASIGHIREYLSSNLGIGYLIDYINDDVTLWLYRNIQYIKNNVGQEQVLDDIIENVLLPSGIEVLDVVYNASDVTLINQDSVVKEPWATEINISLESRGDELNSDLTITEDELQNLEFMLNDISIEARTKYASDMTKKTRFNTSHLMTKAFIIRAYASVKAYNFDILQVGIENWAYDTINSDYRNVLSIVIDGTTYSLDPLDGLYLCLYLMVKIDGGDPSSVNLNLKKVVINTDMSDLDLFTSKFLPDLKEPIGNALPVISTRFSTTVKYTEHLKDVYAFHNYLWEIGSSYNEETTWTNLEKIKHHIFGGTTGYPLLVNADLQAYINDSNLPSDPSDPIDIVTTLIKDFIDIDVDEISEDKKLVNVFKSFLAKTLSYNVQILQGQNDSLVKNVNKNINGIRGFNLIKLLNLELNPLDIATGLVNISLFRETIISSINYATDIITTCFGDSNLDMDFGEYPIRVSQNKHTIVECMTPPDNFKQPVDIKHDDNTPFISGYTATEYSSITEGTDVTMGLDDGISFSPDSVIREVATFATSLQEYSVTISPFTGDSKKETGSKLGSARVLISDIKARPVQDIISDLTDGSTYELGDYEGAKVYLEATSGDSFAIVLPTYTIGDHKILYKRAVVKASTINNNISVSRAVDVITMVDYDSSVEIDITDDIFESPEYNLSSSTDIGNLPFDDGPAISLDKIYNDMDIPFLDRTYGQEEVLTGVLMRLFKSTSDDISVIHSAIPEIMIDDDTTVVEMFEDNFITVESPSVVVSK